jgi:hypothetical protein
MDCNSLGDLSISRLDEQFAAGKEGDFRFACEGAAQSIPQRTCPTFVLDARRHHLEVDTIQVFGQDCPSGTTTAHLEEKSFLTQVDHPAS